MELEADEQSGGLAGGKVGQFSPIRRNNVLPLAFPDAIQIWQPPARGEVRRRCVLWPGPRTAREGDHALDPQLSSHPDGVPQVGLVSPRKLSVCTNRTTPALQPP